MALVSPAHWNCGIIVLAKRLMISDLCSPDDGNGRIAICSTPLDAISLIFLTHFCGLPQMEKESTISSGTKADAVSKLSELRPAAYPCSSI